MEKLSESRIFQVQATPPRPPPVLLELHISHHKYLRSWTQILDQSFEFVSDACDQGLLNHPQFREKPLKFERREIHINPGCVFPCSQISVGPLEIEGDSKCTTCSVFLIHLESLLSSGLCNCACRRVTATTSSSNCSFSHA
jgi:hypothetical protein